MVEFDDYTWLFLDCFMLLALWLVLGAEIALSIYIGAGFGIYAGEKFRKGA